MKKTVKEEEFITDVNSLSVDMFKRYLQLIHIVMIAYFITFTQGNQGPRVLTQQLLSADNVVLLLILYSGNNFGYFDFKDSGSKYSRAENFFLTW